ncbi:MAG: isochorismate synthase [Acidimicrobiia bacterium]|nr:isochorismate synthase [Acidimicrobiia bacterium]
MLIPRPVITDLGSRLRSGGAGLRVAVADIDVDPLDLVRAGAHAFGSAAAFLSPDGTSVGGLGVAWETVASGPDRLTRLDAAVAGLPRDAVVLTGAAFSDDGPRDEAWEGFPPAVAVVPQISVVRVGGRSRIVVAVPAGGNPTMVLAALTSLRPVRPAPTTPSPGLTVEAEPEIDVWRDEVADAVAAIRGGAMDKVVLARSLRVRTARPVDPLAIAAGLRDRYPGCRVFLWRRGEAAFVGASPELLVLREGDRFETRPLAGSAGRGDDPDEDRRLGDRLLSSAKDLEEHRLVVEDVVGRLRPLAASLDRPAHPSLERFSTVQHLATPIVGATDARALELAAAVHPTPAVAGSPRSEALAFIDKVEGLDRGWYAGAVGWIDPAGDGELALALRCALVRNGEAVLYAGNGIVADSDPQREVEETRLKLRPMLELLAGD